MITLDFEPRLYIIARLDIPDMNPGKLAAQACHAGNDFTEYARSNSTITDFEFQKTFECWKGDRTFGTTYTLESNWYDADLAVRECQHYGFVYDPTYPFRNHYRETFVMDIETIAWCFPVHKAEVEAIKDLGLKLHR